MRDGVLSWCDATLDALAAGARLEFCFDGDPGGRLDDDSRRWTEPMTVVEIAYRGTNRSGTRYVGGYVALSEGSRMSFSIDAATRHVRLVPGGERREAQGGPSRDRR